MRKLVLVLFLIAYVFVINAQDYKKIDSLKETLNALPSFNGTESDTLRMKTYFNIGKLFLNSLPDSAKFWFTNATDTLTNYSETSKTPGRSLKNAECLRFAGITHYYQGDYYKTIYYWEKSLQIFLNLNNVNGISRCYSNLGVVYDVLGDYPKATDYYEKSLKLKMTLKTRKELLPVI